MKVLVLNSGSSTQKSALFELNSHSSSEPAAPLWEGKLEWDAKKGVFTNNKEYLLPRLQAQMKGKLPALTAGCELVAAGLGDRVGDYAALALLV